MLMHSAVSLYISARPSLTPVQWKDAHRVIMRFLKLTKRGPDAVNLVLDIADEVLTYFGV